MSSAPRTVFFGSPRSAIPTLKALLEHGVRIEAVVTQPPRGRKRGATGLLTPVADEAGRHGLEVLAPARVGDIVENLRDVSPDVGVIVAYGQIIPKDIIDVFPLGILNLHFSLLPRWRGAAPVQRAILAGDTTTGVCTMLIDEGLDTGPLIECESTGILPEERAGELEDRLAHLGAPLVVRSLDALVDGRANPIPQPSEGASYAPALKREECQLLWDRPASYLERLVRAAHPKPCAYSFWRGKLLKIHRAKAIAENTSGSEEFSGTDNSESLAPGSIASTSGDALVVRCGEGLLEIYEVQLEGRSILSAAEFSRGARISLGDRLGRI
jgi:methionyl-tRNA formyltransferase